MREAMEEDNRIRKKEGFRPGVGPDGEMTYLNGNVYEPLPSLKPHREIGLERARKQFEMWDSEGEIYPDEPDIQEKFPGTDPKGNYCEADMGFQDRLEKIKAAKAVEYEKISQARERVQLINQRAREIDMISTTGPVMKNMFFSKWMKKNGPIPNTMAGRFSTGRRLKIFCPLTIGCFDCTKKDYNHCCHSLIFQNQLLYYHLFACSWYVRTHCPRSASKPPCSFKYSSTFPNSMP